MKRPGFSQPVLASLVLVGLVVSTPVSAFGQTPSSLPQPSQNQQDAEEQQTDPLLDKVQEAIDVSSRRTLSTDVHTPWQIMHGVLALRDDYQIKHQGEKVNALEWIAQGPRYRGENWFQVTRYGGRAHPYTEPYAFQGHPSQFLAMFSMANLPRDFTFQAGEENITIADMVNNAKMEVNSVEEVTWTLWALSHYLKPDARWENKYGEPWSIERLVRIQTQRSLSNAACGGTHALFALSYARNAYLESGQELQGVWRQADRTIRRHVQLARTYQNRDGTLSANFFNGRSYTYDLNERLHAAGHTLEFLMVALPERRLEEQWLRRAVDAVARDLIENGNEPVKCGDLYHAVDGLVIYQERMAPQEKDSTEAQVTQKEQDPSNPVSSEPEDPSEAVVAPKTPPTQ